MAHRSSSRDPVTREVIRSSLVSAADSMAVTVVRTARSAVVKDGMDFSTAVFNRGGEQVAQGLTLPFHMGAMQPALAGVLAQFAGDVEPGDILASNDPYSGASHLPDIFLFKPVFADGTLSAWLCVIAHHTDIGGRVAGGNACDNTEIYQEGLRLPPLKLIAGGGPHADGADGLTAPVHNMANTPIETIEAAQPLLIRRYGFVPDSGDPGRFRGGLGLVREYQLTHDEATLQVRSDRARFLP